MKARKVKREPAPTTVPIKGQTRILVVDDHPIVREALAVLIDRQTGLQCCATAGTLAEAQEKIVSSQPNLVLLDLRLGATEGFESIKTLKTQFPQLPILVISNFDENTYAEPSLRAGASGFVMKEQATDEVVRAIQTVLAGEIYVSAKVRAQAVRRMLQSQRRSENAAGSEVGLLTNRELQVFKAIGAGKTNKQIAGDMDLSVKTIETYREHIKYKLNLASGAELVARARQSVLMESPARV